MAEKISEILESLYPSKSDDERRQDAIRYFRGEYTCEEIMIDIFHDLFGIHIGLYLMWMREELEFALNG